MPTRKLQEAQLSIIAEWEKQADDDRATEEENERINAELERMRGTQAGRR